MDYLPMFVDVRERACLVVGGGQVALRKVELLLRAGARVRVVATRASAALRALSREQGVRIARRVYSSADLRGVELVIAATDDAGVNARVAADAAARRIPVNVVDEPALCSFIMPSILDRSPVLVAVSTAGASPSLARITRARLEAALPARLGALAAFAARHRDAVKQRLGTMAARRRLSRMLLEPAVRGDRARAAQVALIGVGDGEPDQLSLLALRWLGRADVVLHATRVPAAVLALARREAERIDVGRLGARAGWPFSRLAQVAARHARRHRVVCVLREGDPYASPRVREARLLEQRGVPVMRVRPAPSA
jgi:uroporphyrin-III C-methyltransferase/precorrin-2 dehydrogenase/sirohydrochlorin ferrochelatase